MKKLFTFFAIVLLAGSVHAQSLWNPGFSNAHMFRAPWNVQWIGTLSNYNDRMPLIGYENGGSTTPALANGNITLVNVPGTIRNWAVAVDTLGPSDVDTFFIFRSTDKGVTWTRIDGGIQIPFAGPSSQTILYDTTHSLAVNAGDMLCVGMSNAGFIGVLSNGTSCIEFDAKQ